MVDIIVREMRPEDKAVWRDMRAALFGEDPSLIGDVEGYFAGDPMIARAFIAEDGGTLGFVELSLRNYAEGCATSPVPYVEGLYVAEDARRNNVGRLLMAAAEDWARDHGFTEIASDTQIENAASLAAHQAYGFTEVERIACLRKALA
jgi:aminoglycoside 6'-N-acetyltransferase I